MASTTTATVPAVAGGKRGQRSVNTLPLIAPSVILRF